MNKSVGSIAPDKPGITMPRSRFVCGVFETITMPSTVKWVTEARMDNLLYSDIACCNADLHYSTCLVWISCITGSNWTYTVLYITCTGKYTYPPGQQMYCQEFYYPAGLYYTTGLAKPVLDGYIKKKNIRHSPQSSTCSHTENLN